MNEPYWEPLAAAPAPPYTLPLRLEAAGISAGNRPDANACTDNGYYVVYTAGTPASANLPPGVNHAYIHTVAYDPSYLVQTCHYLYGDQIWTRRRVAGTWGSWLLRTPMTGVYTTPALSNNTQYGWNIWFPIVFQIVPVVFLTLNTWGNNTDARPAFARDITVDHFDLYLMNMIQGNSFTIRWMAFNSY